jgi:hypothetical protein
MLLPTGGGKTCGYYEYLDGLYTNIPREKKILVRLNVSRALRASTAMITTVCFVPLLNPTSCSLCFSAMLAGCKSNLHILGQML